MGWLLLGLGLSVDVSGAATGYAGYGLLARPGSLPGADYAALYTSFSVLIATACLSFVLLLTPTGSPPTPRWRWWARQVDLDTLSADLLGVVERTMQPTSASLWLRSLRSARDA